MSADRGPGVDLPRVDLPRVDLPRVDLPRVDLHSHAGRCFLAGLPTGHSAVAAMGAAAVADAIQAARAASMTALVLAAVADFAVLRPDPATGLLAARGFPAARINEILGGNAMKLLGRVL